MSDYASEDEDDFDFFFEDFPSLAHTGDSWAFESDDDYDDDDDDDLWNDVFIHNQSIEIDEAPEPKVQDRDEIKAEVEAKDVIEEDDKYAEQMTKALPRRSKIQFDADDTPVVYIYKPQARKSTHKEERKQPEIEASRRSKQPVVIYDKKKAEQFNKQRESKPGKQQPNIEAPKPETNTEKELKPILIEAQTKDNASKKPKQQLRWSTPPVELKPEMPEPQLIKLEILEPKQVKPEVQEPKPQVKVEPVKAQQEVKVEKAQNEIKAERPVAKTNQGAPNSPQQVKVLDEKKVSVEKEKDQDKGKKPKKKLGPQKDGKLNGPCETHSDCARSQYCDVYSRRCTNKLALSAEGCLEHTECAGEMVACVKLPGGSIIKRCVQACKLLTTSFGCESGETCMAPEYGQLKGLHAEAVGICLTNDHIRKMQQKPFLLDRFKSGTYAGASLVAGVLFGLAVMFLCVRARLKRKYVKEDQQLFQFNSDFPDTIKLPNTGKPRRSSAIDQRIITMGGAKFTHWAPLQATNKNN